MENYRTETGKVLIEYTYSLYATNAILYPINWVFAKIFWRVYMKRVLENIRKMAYHKEPYLYQ